MANHWRDSWGTSWGASWDFASNAAQAVAGKLRKRARTLTRQRAKADQLAEKYNALRDREEAMEHIAPAVAEFTAPEAEALPPVQQVDFEAMARDKAKAQLFLNAIALVKAIEDEEEEIFNFMMALA